MTLLSWLVVGLIAGWLADVVVKGGGFGLIGDLIIGIVGALLGGWIGSRLLGLGDLITGINLPTLVTAFLGAVLLIIILRVVQGRRVRI